MRCSHGRRPAGAVVWSRYRRHLLPSLQGFSRTHSSPLLTAYQHSNIAGWTSVILSGINKFAEVVLGPRQSSLLRFKVLCAIWQEVTQTFLPIISCA